MTEQARRKSRLPLGLLRAGWTYRKVAERSGAQNSAGRGSWEKGFTLLEVLVATAIMGIAVAALFGLLSGALGNIQKLQAPEQALLLGQSQMNELLAAGLEAGDGTTAEFPLDQKIQGRWDDRFRWEAVATRFRSSPERVPGEIILVRMALDVFWKPETGKEEKKLSFETVQLRREAVTFGP